MSNKKVQKVIIYIMAIIMLLSTIGMGLTALL